MKHVLVTGGAGYAGSLLCPQLLANGYKVTAYDVCYFGTDFLPLHDPNFTLIEGDIRDISKFEASLGGLDIIVHLACISNDASFELDENLSTSVNMDAFEPMVAAAKKAGVKRFVYASSSSVYGVSEQPNVTEEHKLLPLTLYNKYKGLCEPILKKYTDDDFVGVTFRPATLCGYAPRQRLDLSVNILTNHAVSNNKITVFGGNQMRPNLHVQDYCDAVELLMTAPAEKVQNEVFNVGFQNMSIADLALLVKQVVEAEFLDKPDISIVTTPSDDNRSYHINSDKITRVLGFKPKYNIEDAIRHLCEAFKEGKLPNSMTDINYYNVKTLLAREAE
ncbi:SDR family oxidoreductase [Planktomarina sp.]|nr:SDR family oxidoreductase [Planktomarina sp.]